MQHLALKKRSFGQGMTEYIIITALIAIAAIGAYSFFGQTIRHQVAGMANEMAGESANGDIANAKGTAGQAVGAAGTATNLGNYDETASGATGGGAGGAGE